MKLHPLSVPYRALTRGVSVATVLLFSGTAAAGGVAWITIPLVAALAVVGFLGAAAWESAYYRRFEYELSPDTFDIASGVVSRRNREIPLHRIQNVDIRRNAVQRALDIATVNLETAGGGETEASLRYVGYDEAKRLQRELQRLKSREPLEEAADETLLFELGGGELLLLSALSLDPRALTMLAVLGPLVGVSVPFEELPEATGVAIAAGVVGLLLAVVAALWITGAAVTFARFYGFRLTRHGDELRYERGLVQRYDGSIPLEKLQTVTLKENPLMRQFGYATLLVETAGYAAGQSPSGGSEAAVPLARRPRAVELARSLGGFDVGALSFTRPPKRARRRYAGRYAIAVGLLTGALFVADVLTGRVGAWYVPLALLVVAWPAAHYKWRHHGYALEDEYAVTRGGFWRRATTVVPYYRVQTVIQRQTIFQRRWSLASVVVDTAGSLSLAGRDAVAADLDAADAATLRETVHDRLQTQLRRRRTASGPDRAQ